jgi:GTP-binding protein EngB required for normal cell division
MNPSPLYFQQQGTGGSPGPGTAVGTVLSRNLAQLAKWKQKAPRKKKRNSDNNGNHNPNTFHRRQTPANPNSLSSQRKNAKSVHPEDYHSQPADSFADANISASIDADIGTSAALDSAGAASAAYHIPPALLLPTASPYAYVAQIAAQTAGIDPRSLFSECVTDKDDDPQEALPASFRHGAFHYLPPAAFGHELSNSNQTPEVAFLGRSNVGKSSLVNALMRRSLARTSKQPGRTQQVQYYGWLPNHPTDIDNHDNKSKSSNKEKDKISPDKATAFLVDLPGYGFAVAPHKTVDAWQAVTQEWLVDRAHTGSLRRLYLLLDGRHGAQAHDLDVQTWLEQNDIPYSIVFTKADQSNRPNLVKYVNQACMRYHQHYMDMEHDSEEGEDGSETTLAMGPVVHVTSSKTGAGMAELWSAMEAEFATQVVVKDNDNGSHHGYDVKDHGSNHESDDDDDVFDELYDDDEYDYDDESDESDDERELESSESGENTHK